MKTGMMLAILAGAAVTSAASATTYTESASNNTKATAEAITLSNAGGDIINGSTSSTDTDYLRVNVSGAVANTIYLNTLAVTTGTGASVSTRGLTWSSGSITAGSDQQLLSGRVTGDSIKWYSFGTSQSSMVLRAAKTTTGAASYSLTHGITAVTPIGLTVNAGVFNIGTKYSGDGEVQIYDGNLNLVGQNDNRPSTGVNAYSTTGLTAEVRGFNLVNGNTYYVAVSNNNTATNVGGVSTSGDPFYEDFFAFSGPRTGVLDYANTLHRPSNTSISPTSGSLFGADLWLNGAVAASQGTVNGQEVQWYAITVVPTPGSLALLGMGMVIAGRRRR